MYKNSLKPLTFLLLLKNSFTIKPPLSFLLSLVFQSYLLFNLSRFLVLLSLTFYFFNMIVALFMEFVNTSLLYYILFVHSCGIYIAIFIHFAHT